jgi:hypothetical protein
LMTSRERLSRPGQGKTDPVDAVAIAGITGGCQVLCVSTVVDLELIVVSGVAVPPVLMMCRCSLRSRSFLQ